MDAKKFKIKLKDLKKIKKYAYLLAYSRKKHYAIPLPFPLPVLVKRQNIYTQVPIVPRYVQKPASQQMYSETNYESLDAPYTMQSSNHLYDYKNQIHNNYPEPEPEHTMNSPTYIKAKQRIRSQYQPQMRGPIQMGPTKYLSQFMNHVHTPWDGEQNREIFTKLLSGQAKLVMPNQIHLGSFILAPKQSAQKSLGRYPNTLNSVDGGKDDEQQDNGSSNSNSSETSHMSEQGMKQSASEIYMSAIRPALDLVDPLYRIHAPRLVQLAPFSKQFYSRPVSMIQPQMAAAANAFMSLTEPQIVAASKQVESSALAEGMDLANGASVIPILPIADANYQERLIRLMRRAKNLDASQRVALVGPSLGHERAARLSEQSPIFVAAPHHLGIPMIPGQLRLINY